MVTVPSSGSLPFSELPGLGVVDHVGIVVDDLESAVAFYTEVLGLRVEHREDNPEQGVREVMLSSPGPGPTQVQLLDPLTPTSTVARFRERRGPGLHHIAYEVPDLANAVEILRGRGVRLIYDSPRAGTRGSLINFVHPGSTGGVLVELVEPARSDHDRG